MNKEIELKARVDGPEIIRERLESVYGSFSVINKDDVYYVYGNAGANGDGQPVRLRSDSGVSIVTLKRKSMKNGIEINDELEFEVDKPENFLEFLKMTGAKRWLSKKKRGWKFTDKDTGFPAVIELCEVEKLGWFLEIEVVVKNPDEKQITVAGDKIIKILNEAGISEDKIEPRYYSDMLLEKSDGCLP